MSDDENRCDEAWKAAAHRRQMDQWSEQPGECLKCGLPMRLHPPERSYAAELWMCAKAREAMASDTAAPPMEPYVVTSAEDDGPGTLRDAMRQAVASEGQQQP